MPAKKKAGRVASSSNFSKAARVAAKINAEYQAEVVHVGSQMRFKRIPRIPTGCFALDFETGGGWPRGRLIHLYGRQSTGKSFLSYKAIAEAQKYCQWCTSLVKQGGCDCGANDPIAAAYIDPEHTDSAEWRKKLDVDPDLFLYVDVEYGEETVDYCSSLVRMPEVGIIVIDSIAAIAPAEVVEKSASDNISPGSLARLVTRGTRAWQAGLNAKYKHPKLREADPDNPGKTRPQMWPNLCSIFALNQLRDVINSSFPMPPQPPGGHALRCMASIETRLAFAPSDVAFTGDREAHEAYAEAVRINFFTEKNKVYSPRRMGTFSVNFSYATIDDNDSMYHYALRWGIITKKGSWYSFDDCRVQGEGPFLAALYEKPALLNKMHAAVTKQAHDEIEAMIAPDSLEEVPDEPAESAAAQ